MLGIKDAFKKIYSGDDALLKHMMLFVLSGVPVMLSTPLNEISRREDLSTMDITMIFAALAVMLVIAIYLAGYTYGIMHNSFDKTKETILPDFDKSWFKIYFKGLPLLLCWLSYAIIYIILFFIVAVILNTGLSLLIPIKISSWIIMTIYTVIAALILLMIQFISVGFSKEYKRDGLYHFELIFTYLRKTIKSVLWLMVKLIPIFIVILALYILGKGNDVMSYIITAIGAYLYSITYFVISYCYVQIYKEKLSDTAVE